MSCAKNRIIQFIIILLSFADISVFANDNIIDLKYKNEEGFRRFYLVGKSGISDYGFFEFNSSDPDNLFSAKDTTSDQYKGLSNLTLVGSLFDYKRKRFNNTIAMSSTYGLFAATTVLSAAFLTLGLASETIDDTSRAFMISGGVLLFFSSAELITGSIFLGRMIYFMVKYNKTKKEILKELNKSNTSLIKFKKINIRFVVEIT